jgi:hypothetical protein
MRARSNNHGSRKGRETVLSDHHVGVAFSSAAGDQQLTGTANGESAAVIDGVVADAEVFGGFDAGWGGFGRAVQAWADVVRGPRGRTATNVVRRQRQR